MIENIEEFYVVNDIYSKLDTYFKESIKDGAPLKKIIEKAENIIREMGADLAFPVNLSVNNIAAHDTAGDREERYLKKEDVVKIDIGIQKDGYVIDSAKTYIAGENREGNEIREVSEKVIKKVKKSLYIGIKVSEISEIIESVIRKSGKGIVVNLSGHSLGKYIVHGDITIPNIKNNISSTLDKGSLFAVEPFVVSGGMDIKVKDHARVEIYKINAFYKGGVRDKYASILWKEITNNYSHGLPFAKRWLTSLPPGILKERSLLYLQTIGALQSYPVLYHPNDKVLISQSEVTFYFGKDDIYTFGFEF